MKFHQPKSQSEAGSVLLVSMIITAVLGLTLASYLIMTQQQNVSVVRSQTWNSAIVMSEAGVEDALALLNKFNSNFDKLTNWSTSTSISGDNWAALGANTYYVRRYLGDGYYDAYITNTGTTPIISSKGYIPWTYNGGAGPQQQYATIGNQQVQGPSMTSRGVAVNTKIDPLINVAMAALQTIDFNGKNVETDSFDSSDPNYSDNGAYPALFPAKQKANGDVVTDMGIVNSLSVGNAKIKGSAKTGANGTLAIGPNGSVGDKAWVESGATGVQSGHFADDFNVLFPSVTLPSTTWSSVSYYSSGTMIGGVSYNWVINGNGDYYIDQLLKPLYVSGKVRLLIQTKIALNGSNDRIYIATNSSLKIYMMGANADIGGNGIVNATGNANNLFYFGLPSNTSLTYGGNGTFYGAVYAPQAVFTLNGGGSTVYDFVGASVTKSVKMNGHFKFHYDEALKNNGMGRGYIPTSWKEM